VATTRLLVRLLDALVRRFKHCVSVRQPGKFIQRLLEEALPPENGSDNDPLYQAALAVENEHKLAAEMAEWEIATIDDGLGDGPAKRPWVRHTASTLSPIAVRSKRVCGASCKSESEVSFC